MTDKKSELEIRAQSMINSLGAQRLEAMDRCVHVAAELALSQARVAELQSELDALKAKPKTKKEPKSDAG